MTTKKNGLQNNMKLEKIKKNHKTDKTRVSL